MGNNCFNMFSTKPQDKSLIVYGNGIKETAKQQTEEEKEMAMLNRRLQMLKIQITTGNRSTTDPALQSELRDLFLSIKEKQDALRILSVTKNVMERDRSTVVQEKAQMLLLKVRHEAQKHLQPARSKLASKGEEFDKQQSFAAARLDDLTDFMGEKLVGAHEYAQEDDEMKDGFGGLSGVDTAVADFLAECRSDMVTLAPSSSGTIGERSVSGVYRIEAHESDNEDTEELLDTIPSSLAPVKPTSTTAALDMS
jgi:hypothetical protein